VGFGIIPRIPAPLIVYEYMLVAAGIEVGAGAPLAVQASTLGIGRRA
jgi:hypothetical protein